MSLTRVSPSLIAVANNVTSNVFGSANTIPSLTFDGSGVITSASNTAIQINTADIVNGAITTDKIATGAVVTADIADANVTTAKIADSSITTSKIADGNVTNAKIDTVANTKITGVMTASQLANTSVTAGTYGGSSNSALITIDAQGRITSASNVAAGSGQIQSQLFTSPGTWTKPGTVTQVKVTVIGGGGGGYWNSSGGTGGTSSFGPAVSATGGSGGPGPGSYGSAGSVTISSGTAIHAKGFSPSFFTTNAALLTFGDVFSGTARLATTSPVAYSTTSSQIAGAGSAVGPISPIGYGGLGGVAVAVVPVSAPVSVTVGTGGPAPPPSGNYAGCDGAVLVEWIG